MKRKRNSKRVTYACSHIFFFSTRSSLGLLITQNIYAYFGYSFFKHCYFFKGYAKLVSKSGAASVIKNPLQRKIGDRSGGLELKP